MEDVWDWWLMYGFEGIAGGVLGGVVTAGAVWLTLRHERTLRKDETSRQDLAEQKRVVGRILEQAIDLDAVFADDTKTFDDIHGALMALDRQLRLAVPVMPTLGGLGETLQKAVGAIHILSGRTTLSFVQTGRLAGTLMRRCTSWLSAPERYDDKAHDNAEKRAHGATVMDDVMLTPYDEVMKRERDLGWRELE